MGLSPLLLAIRKSSLCLVAIRENIAILWGLDSRSLTYTLVQLLGRPGYLVREYISGHRLVSFPPVKMLVIVCLFVVFSMVVASDDKQ